MRHKVKHVVAKFSASRHRWFCCCVQATSWRDISVSNANYTIRYDSVYLTCSKKMTGSQLSLPHGINKKLKCETKNKMTSVIGPLQSRYHESNRVCYSLELFVFANTITGNGYIRRHDTFWLDCQWFDAYASKLWIRMNQKSAKDWYDLAIKRAGRDSLRCRPTPLSHSVLFASVSLSSSLSPSLSSYIYKFIRQQYKNNKQLN